jgi:hypothetical protein
MINKTIFHQLLGFLFYVMLQLIVFRNIWVFDIAYCWVYVAPILLLPVQVKNWVLIIVAFLLGLFVDTLYDKIGMNAAACVLIAFLRPFLINSMIGKNTGNDDIKELSINTIGFQSFSVYLLLLLLAHHFLLNIINAASSAFFMRTLAKTVFSAFFSYLMIIASQMLFYSRKSKR